MQKAPYGSSFTSRREFTQLGTKHRYIIWDNIPKLYEVKQKMVKISSYFVSEMVKNSQIKYYIMLTAQNYGA